MAAIDAHDVGGFDLDYFYCHISAHRRLRARKRPHRVGDFRRAHDRRTQSMVSRASESEREHWRGGRFYSSTWHILTHDADENEFRETPRQQIHEIESHACVFRFDGALIFTSIQKFYKAVLTAVKRWERREAAAMRTDESGYRWRVAHERRRRTDRGPKFDANAAATTNVAAVGAAGAIARRRRSSDPEFTRIFASTRSATVLIIDCSSFPYIDYLGLCTLKRVSKRTLEIRLHEARVYRFIKILSLRASL